MTFAPIAIVGRGCVLPGALTPEALGDLSAAGGVALSRAPEGRWGVHERDILTPADQPRPDRTWSNRGGYVEGFDAAFDASRYEAERVAAGEAPLGTLDPVFTWLLHAADAALSDAGLEERGRVGAVVGNLSFPTAGMARGCEAHWRRSVGDRVDDASDPRNRFMSGLPAHLLARLLGLGGDAYALDAACASSLYAIAIACRKLARGECDAMLAGAVNAADDLFLHVGFGALQALSASERSRPFHADADGLLPAEGAAVVALERLDDALAAGRTVHGVIRGVGLSNDGRGGGLLVPSRDGQVRAMRQAYDEAGVSPRDVTWVECHATGTSVGDGTEIASMAEVFGDEGEPLAIGSLKANLGHSITVAGAAGLLRVLEAMRRRELPPTPHLDREHEALGGARFEVLQEARPWRGRRLAGVSAFGFGGNNAHLVVEAYEPERVLPTPAPQEAPAALAVIGIGARVADGASASALQADLAAPPRSAAMAEVALPLRGLRFPPRDLEETLPQQLAVLAACLEATRDLDDRAMPHERSAVWVGMQCDTAVARHGARWRMPSWAKAWGADERWTEAARDGFAPLLGAAGVLGCMPNVCANRVGSQLDLRGPSHTVSAEEASGLRALELAADALGRGAIDCAIVAATDVCADDAHQRAAAAMGLTGPPGDAAVALVVVRANDAARLGRPVLATLQLDGGGSDWDDAQVTDRFGHPHASKGLLSVAAAVLACTEGAPRPAPAEGYRVSVDALGGQQAGVSVVPPSTRTALPPALAAEGPQLRVPAHLPAPTLPTAPRAAASGMPAAPPLPAAGSTPAATPRPKASTPSRRPAVGGATRDRAVAALLAQRQRMLDVHQAYLATQQQAHDRYIARQQAAWRALTAAPAAPTAAPRKPPVSSAPPAAPRLPAFDKAALEVHAAGRISTLFGPKFEQQDEHAVQVRMPSGRLLLADRVTAIDAPCGELGEGTVWTETDVLPDSWYLHAGRMPAGLMIEAGQADLFLISYMGIDFFNRGERAYRLLGCEVTYKRSLPRAGETLVYDIHVDGHAKQGDVRLFFFHYDCRVGDEVVLSVRNGQAGFFNDTELEASEGVLWSPEEQAIDPDARVDPPAVVCTRDRFDDAQVRALADGDLFGCFGPGFERGQTHVRTPSIQGGDMRFIDTIEAFDPKGGPWGRGYLRARTRIRPDDWFFDGHFVNDPCMPGTLMLEGCLQMMAFYLAGLGYTLDRDGWRFEPLIDHASLLRCRGQVLPGERELSCEIFVEEVHDGPEPILYADLLGTIDGLKAFHARRMAIRMVPDFPLTTRSHTMPPLAGREVVEVDGFRFDQASLMACAWGRPSHAFGPMYARFDGTRRVARLPGPPYHFMSHVRSIDGPLGGMETGTTIAIDYDVPTADWYFDANPNGAMPFCVLLEAVLQPCGWLASYVGSATTSEQDLSFRNLDGTGTVHVDVLPAQGRLCTTTKLTRIAQTGGMIIESFTLQCTLATPQGEVPVYDLETVFGFFPKEALANQIGLPTTDAQRALLEHVGESVDLRTKPAAFFSGRARLPDAPLLMLDRIRGLDLTGGADGLGCAIGEKDVDPNEWFFKAHFFQDPVQPGSLGIEAMLQLLQAVMIRAGMHDGMAAPRFEGLRLGASMTWKYRGQVIPENRLITTSLEITERGRDARGAYAVARASLWVDGKRIYEANDLAMRVVDGAATQG